MQNANSGKCTIIVRDNAEIGPNDMQMTKADGPDDMGHVFGAGKGIMPTIYTYKDDEHKPKRMILNADKTASIWEYFASEEKYIEFIQTLALATETDVTISGEAFVKGSVYGGSENGLVQYDTKVTIEGNCQIGNGEGKTERYTTTQWENENPADFKECAHWEYGLDTNGDGKKDLFAPYDPNANATGELGKYSSGKSTEGGRRVASDGHTFYGNVFGGGSGSVPYFDTTEGISKYLPSAGLVKGNTHVNINGGHILTNVYGGNEATNVLGMAYVTMTGGTIGVPRTAQQIKDHPVTCYLFGAGKGDQRIFFNKETNVNDAIVKVEGGRIYGSVFGGGEDGHVLRNTTVTIGKTDGTGPKIGTVGSTYVDGNVFGGGRGFGGEALTAGNVGGSVDLIINGGTMLGSIYGGGRLASVGYGLYLTTEKGFGTNNDDGYGKMQDDGYSDWTKGEDGQYTRTEISGFKRGYITVTVNGGTIGKEFANDAEGEHSGNVFGGSMGRLTKLDGTPFDTADHWALLATAKSTTVNINGGTIMRSVYGGGEMGTVTTNAIVNVSGGTIGTSGKGGAEFGNVYGGGKGYLDPAQTYVGAGIVKGNTNVTIKNGASGGTTTTPTIYQNVYGGGELGYVGMFTTPDHKEYTWTENTGLCTVGVAGGTITGHVFGAGKGKDDTFECERAMVRTTSVAVSGGKVGGNVYGGGEVGRVDQNSAVTIGSATGDSAPTITGSVFGAGAGVETHGYSALVRGNTAVIVQGNAKVGNSVYGGGQIAAVGRYSLTNGMPTGLVSGGQCKVTIRGNAEIGTVSQGDVFGAGMGVTPHYYPVGTDSYSDNGDKPKRMMTYNTTPARNSDDEGKTWDYYVDENNIKDERYVWEYLNSREEYMNFLQTLALATDTKVSIEGSVQVNGSVYGGSKSGFVQRDTDVMILGGTIGSSNNGGDVFGGGLGITDNDVAGRVRSNTTVTIISGTMYGSVYGGGALGKSNTEPTSNVYPTATVNLIGGTIKGDAYGGGLGNATTAANVGNTKVNLNGLAVSEYNGWYTTWVNSLPAGDLKTQLSSSFTALDVNDDGDNADEGVDFYYTNKGCVVSRVFGANITNGTPLGTDLVHVYKTVKKESNGDIMEKPTKETNTYKLEAVYGGGNRAAYDPTSSSNVANVIIDGCSLTSIETVYGGGNAASAPGTHVVVNSCYEIGTLFAGGNGAGEGNPGADIGLIALKTDGTPYTNDPTKQAYGTGVALAELRGGTIHKAFGGSNTKGNVRTSGTVTLDEADPEGCALCIKEVYGAGNEADQDGTSNIDLGCISYLSEIYGGAKNADVNNDIVLTIQSGRFDRVFGGNNLGGNISGTITVNIEEMGCHPIVIGQLFGGGNQAAYTAPWKDENDHSKGRKDSPTVNVKSFTSIGEIYGGGFGNSADITGNTFVNINEHKGKFADKEATVDFTDENGNPVTGVKVSENTGKWIHFNVGDNKTVTVWQPEHREGAIGTIGNVFGGGNEANVTGSTNVRIGNESYVPIESVVAGKTDVRGYYTCTGAGTTESPYVYTPVPAVLAAEGVTYYRRVVNNNEETYEVVASGITVGETDVSDYYTRSGEGTEVSHYVYTSLTPLANENTTYYKAVLGANITGNVYGGGNAADVSGDTNVVIGREAPE